MKALPGNLTSIIIIVMIIILMILLKIKTSESGVLINSFYKLNKYT